MARTLTLRLDDETEAALAEQEAARPMVSTTEIIREAIGALSSVVYFVRRSDRAVKIGYTASIQSRMGALRSEHGTLVLEALMPGGRFEETELHAALEKERIGRPGTEWFCGKETDARIQRVVRAWGRPSESAKPMRKRTSQELVALHVRIPRRFFNEITAWRDQSGDVKMNLSDAVRKLLEHGLEERAK